MYLGIEISLPPEDKMTITDVEFWINSRRKSPSLDLTLVIVKYA
jgi:hypothetical protein